MPRNGFPALSFTMNVTPLGAKDGGESPGFLWYNNGIDVFALWLLSIWFFLYHQQMGEVSQSGPKKSLEVKADVGAQISGWLQRNEICPIQPSEIRIFLSTSLSHCKVHYWFDREGAVSWLHQCLFCYSQRPFSTSVALVAYTRLYLIRCHKDLFHCCQRLFGVCASNSWRAAGWIPPTSTQTCPLGNRETPMSFPWVSLANLTGLFVHLLPDSMQPLHREL